MTTQTAPRTTSRKGWASLTSFAKQYRMPDGSWLPITSFEDIDKWMAAWGETDIGGQPQTGGSEGKNTPTPRPGEAEAMDWIRNYTGTFGLILDLRADRRFGSKWFRLSERQIEVVLKSKARDMAPKVERKQTGRDLLALPTGRTCAAVDNDSGGLTFLLIDVPAELDRFKQPNRWAGWAFVKQQQGPNEIKIGSQRPGETYSGQWANLIDRVLADPLEAVRRYGHELGVCGVCQLPLTNAESRAAGIGPVCERKMSERFGA